MHWSGFPRIDIEGILNMLRGTRGCILAPWAETSAETCSACGLPLGRMGQWVERAHDSPEPERRHLECAAADHFDDQPGPRPSWVLALPKHRPIFFESRGGPFAIPDIPRAEHGHQLGPQLQKGAGYLYIVVTKGIGLAYIGATKVSVRARFFRHVVAYGVFPGALASYLESHPEERSTAQVFVFRVKGDLGDAEAALIATLQPELNVQHRRDHPRPILRLGERPGIYYPG